MAVAFVVEDGTGLSNATSYVTVVEARDYISIKPTNAKWDALADEQVEAYLMWATRLLDQRAFFYGQKAVQSSALRWPRSGVMDRDGISVPYDTIPEPIKAATIEIAFFLCTQSVDPSTGLPQTSGAIKSIKADVVEIVYDDGRYQDPTLFPLGINDLLLGYGSLQTSTTGSSFGRVVRA
jgi:hypothetical protein